MNLQNSVKIVILTELIAKISSFQILHIYKAKDVR